MGLLAVAAQDRRGGRRLGPHPADLQRHFLPRFGIGEDFHQILIGLDGRFVHRHDYVGREHAALLGRSLLVKVTDRSPDLDGAGPARGLGVDRLHRGVHPYGLQAPIGVGGFLFRGFGRLRIGRDERATENKGNHDTAPSSVSEALAVDHRRPWRADLEVTPIILRPGNPPPQQGPAKISQEICRRDFSHSPHIGCGARLHFTHLSQGPKLEMWCRETGCEFESRALR
jgi:hypothetical protein